MAHPLHPALVHFPVACWSLTTFGDLAGLVFHDQRVWVVSGVLLVLGLVTALAAMSAGLIELRKIEEGSAAMRVANWHMSLIVIVWALYGLALFMRLNGANLMPPNGISIGLSVLGFLLLGAAGWLGGSLVYEHGIGVDIANSQKR
ncbi:MAG TPA: DUF2231 domain-containing protein [Gallionella sp.]|nr:DUF2231 domain-containing protein [Gallionella sp.]